MIQNDEDFRKTLQHADQLRKRLHCHLHAHWDFEFARGLPGREGSRVVNPVRLIRHRAACREQTHSGEGAAYPVSDLFWSVRCENIHGKNAGETAWVGGYSIS